MTIHLNPFVWDRPLDDPSKIIGMEAFANQVALTLKGQTNVALFGPRDTGKTTFTNQLALELAKDARRRRAAVRRGQGQPAARRQHPRVHRLRARRDVEPPGQAAAPRRAASDRCAGEGDRLRHQGHQGLGQALGAQARAGRRDAARAADRAAVAVSERPRRGLRRVPAAAPLPGRSAGDHPLGADELGRQPRLAAVHRVDPQRAEDDARRLRAADLRRGGSDAAAQPSTASTSSSTSTSSSRRPASRPTRMRSSHLLNADPVHPRSTQQLAWECWTDTARRASR